MSRKKINKRYRLYAMKVTPENMSLAHQERFARITPEYVLVYTKHKHTVFAEITDENVKILSDKDRQWLMDCNMALIAEEVVNGKNDFVAEMSVKIAELEKALVREKELIEHGDGECGK